MWKSYYFTGSCYDSFLYIGGRLVVVDWMGERCWLKNAEEVREINWLVTRKTWLIISP